MGVRLQDTGIVAARVLPGAEPRVTAAMWNLDVLAGRFAEIAGGAGLSLCAGLIREAQAAGGMGAWIGDARSSFYPPDLAACGVDLAALTVLRLESAKLWRGCDTLLRCGAFALIVVDVCGALTLPFPMQTRLAGLAQHHNTALIALTRSSRRDQPRSSLVSLRAETALRRAGRDCFACEARIVKDKRRVPGWAHEEFRRGTNSLC